MALPQITTALPHYRSALLLRYTPLLHALPHYCDTSLLRYLLATALPCHCVTSVPRYLKTAPRCNNLC